MNGVLTVNKADLLITSATRSFLYDGNTHSDNTYSVMLNGVTVNSIAVGDYTMIYDGVEHTYAENTNPILTIKAEGTNTGLLAVHHLAGTTMTGARTNAVTETIAISAAVIKDASDNNVTANYDLHFVDGTLTITKRTGVVVTIQEHGKEVDYNATDQKVTGYSVASIADPVSLYTVADFRFVGIASDTVTHGTGAEDALHVYDMNLRPEHFENTNPNYDTVTFVIRDSALYIYPKMKEEHTTVDITCNLNNGGAHNDGTATITVTGGRQKHDGMYGFVIDGGASADFASPHTFTGLQQGNHSVVVSDSLGYTVSIDFFIDEPVEMTAAITVPMDIADRCPNQGTYPVSVTVENGIADLTYAWGTDATAANAATTTVAQAATPDCSHEYKVTILVTDANSCTVTDTAYFTVMDTVKPTFTAPADTTICRVAGEIVAPVT